MSSVSQFNIGNNVCYKDSSGSCVGTIVCFSDPEITSSFDVVVEWEDGSATTEFAADLMEHSPLKDEKSDNEKRSLSGIYEDDCLYVICYSTGHTKNNTDEIEVAVEKTFQSKHKAQMFISKLNKEFYGELFVVPFKPV